MTPCCRMDDYDDFVWVRLTELAPKGKKPRTAVRMVSEFEWFTTVNNEQFLLDLPMLRTIPPSGSGGYSPGSLVGRVLHGCTH